jgi:dihydrofolate synthase/folylpolyglutamate synthase
VSQPDYQAAIDYILSFADYERASRSSAIFDTTRIDALLQRLGQPHLAAESVHIAGTKGKGSTAAMIASILSASGYKTGLYTSPHLHSFTERIQIDGRSIPEADFASLVQKLKPEFDAFNQLGVHGQLTTFEILTALAFAHFKEGKVDFQVLETGLGGRLDATNVVRPRVCAITSISLDHTEVLGSTLAQIAAEKAGIIKPGCVVVSAPQPPEVRSVMSRTCRDRGARLVEVSREIAWSVKERGDRGQSFRLQGPRGTYDLTIPLLGEHQLDNAAVAVGVAEVLAGLGTRISAEGIAAGLLRVSWPGRLQVLRRHPLLVVDGAHNADSAAKLAKALSEYFDFDRAVLVVGTSRDKDAGGIIDELLPICGKVIVTSSRNPRAAETSTLKTEFARRGVAAREAETVESAVNMALEEAGQGDLVCVTGSLFVVAEAIDYYNRRAAQESTAD